MFEDDVKLRNTELINGRTVLGLVQSFKFNNEFEGYTLFQYRGQRRGGWIFGWTIHWNVRQSRSRRVELSATMHHELRAHMVLADFGRNVPRARHSDPYARGEGPPTSEADKVGEAAEKEARENAKKP